MHSIHQVVAALMKAAQNFQHEDDFLPGPQSYHRGHHQLWKSLREPKPANPKKKAARKAAKKARAITRGH